MGSSIVEFVTPPEPGIVTFDFVTNLVGKNRILDRSPEPPGSIPGINRPPPERYNLNRRTHMLEVVLRLALCLIFVITAPGTRSVAESHQMDCCDHPTVTSCCMETSICCFESPQDLPSKVSSPLVISHATGPRAGVDVETWYRSTGFSQIRPKPPPDLVPADRQALLSSFLI